jgi:hypothetical protein
MRGIGAHHIQKFFTFLIPQINTLSFVQNHGQGVVIGGHMGIFLLDGLLGGGFLEFFQDFV